METLLKLSDSRGIVPHGLRKIATPLMRQLAPDGSIWKPFACPIEGCKKRYTAERYCAIHKESMCVNITRIRGYRARAKLADAVAQEGAMPNQRAVGHGKRTGENTTVTISKTQTPERPVSGIFKGGEVHNNISDDIDQTTTMRNLENMSDIAKRASLKVLESGGQADKSFVKLSSEEDMLTHAKIMHKTETTEIFWEEHRNNNAEPRSTRSKTKTRPEISKAIAYLRKVSKRSIPETKTIEPPQNPNVAIISEKHSKTESLLQQQVNKLVLGSSGICKLVAAADVVSSSKTVALDSVSRVFTTRSGSVSDTEAKDNKSISNKISDSMADRRESERNKKRRSKKDPSNNPENEDNGKGCNVKGRMIINDNYFSPDCGASIIRTGRTNRPLASEVKVASVKDDELQNSTRVSKKQQGETTVNLKDEIEIEVDASIPKARALSTRRGYTAESQGLEFNYLETKAHREGRPAQKSKKQLSVIREVNKDNKKTKHVVADGVILSQMDSSRESLEPKLSHIGKGDEGKAVLSLSDKTKDTLNAKLEYENYDTKERGISAARQRLSSQRWRTRNTNTLVQLESEVAGIDLGEWNIKSETDGNVKLGECNDAILGSDREITAAHNISSRRDMATYESTSATGEMLLNHRETSDQIRCSSKEIEAQSGKIGENIATEWLDERKKSKGSANESESGNDDTKHSIPGRRKLPLRRARGGYCKSSAQIEDDHESNNLFISEKNSSFKEKNIMKVNIEREKHRTTIKSRLRSATKSMLIPDCQSKTTFKFASDNCPTLGKHRKFSSKNPVYNKGDRILKKFDDDPAFYEGRLVSFDEQQGWWKVCYDFDGDEEEIDVRDLAPLIKNWQWENEYNTDGSQYCINMPTVPLKVKRIIETPNEHVHIGKRNFRGETFCSTTPSAEPCVNSKVNTMSTFISANSTPSGVVPFDISEASGVLVEAEQDVSPDNETIALSNAPAQNLSSSPSSNEQSCLGTTNQIQSKYQNHVNPPKRSCTDVCEPSWDKGMRVRVIPGSHKFQEYIGMNGVIVKKRQSWLVVQVDGLGSSGEIVIRKMCLTPNYTKKKKKKMNATSFDGDKTERIVFENESMSAVNPSCINQRSEILQGAQTDEMLMHDNLGIVPAKTPLLTSKTANYERSIIVSVKGPLAGKSIPQKAVARQYSTEGPRTTPRDIHLRRRTSVASAHPTIPVGIDDKTRSSSTSTSRVPSPDFKAARGDTVANSRDAAKIPIQHTKKDGQNIDVSNITSTSVGVIDQHQKLNAALSSTDFKEPSCCSIRKGMGHQSTSRSSLKGKIKEMY